jgi:hypothetical protein
VFLHALRLGERLEIRDQNLQENMTAVVMAWRRVTDLRLIIILHELDTAHLDVFAFEHAEHLGGVVLACAVRVT